MATLGRPSKGGGKRRPKPAAMPSIPEDRETKNDENGRLLDDSDMNDGFGGLVDTGGLSREELEELGQFPDANGPSSSAPRTRIIGSGPNARIVMEGEEGFDTGVMGGGAGNTNSGGANALSQISALTGIDLGSAALGGGGGAGAGGAADESGPGQKRKSRGFGIKSGESISAAGLQAYEDDDDGITTRQGADDDNSDDEIVEAKVSNKKAGVAGLDYYGEGEEEIKNELLHEEETKDDDESETNSGPGGTKLKSILQKPGSQSPRKSVRFAPGSGSSSSSSGGKKGAGKKGKKGKAGAAAAANVPDFDKDYDYDDFRNMRYLSRGSHDEVRGYDSPNIGKL
jgi:hypothetical protein